MLANKPQSVDERLTFTTTYSLHLPTHHLRRLLVKHWHLIEKSPLLSRLFPNTPTIAFRTHKSIRKQLTRARLEDSKIVYKIDRDLNLLCEPLPAPDAPPLIQKCNDNCLTCKALDTKLYIKSTSINTYHNLKIKSTISCKTRNVIYVITCTRCKAQYTGMTTQPLYNRFSTHMREMFSKRPPNWIQTCLYRHFQKKHHVPSDARVQPVEWIEDRSLKKRECMGQSPENNRALWTEHHPIALLHLLPLFFISQLYPHQKIHSSRMYPPLASTFYFVSSSRHFTCCTP